MNMKIGVLLILGMLVLSACGGEEAQPTGSEAADEEMNMPEENTNEEVVEEETTVEEGTEEEAEKEQSTEEQPVTDAAEVASGEASPLLSKGKMTSFAFNEIGEFLIYCAPHPVMKMTVIVEEGATNSEVLALDIADYEFSEESITVSPGTVITWTNQDSAQHNVAFE